MYITHEFPQLKGNKRSQMLTFMFKTFLPYLNLGLRSYGNFLYFFFVEGWHEGNILTPMNFDSIV